jgi:hypothetical protein
MITKSTLSTLTFWLKELKKEAMEYGHFPHAYCNEYWFDHRHQITSPFRCMAYNRAVRRINALSKLIKESK